MVSAFPPPCHNQGVLDHPPSPQRLAIVAAALDRLPSGVDPAVREEAARLVGYLGAHIGSPGGDLVVAVIGVGGSGKSTLVNTLARRRVTAAGTRRPTTTELVAWGGDRLPAVLDPLRRTVPGKMVDGSVPPPPGLVVVDTPPPDVTGADGRPLSHSAIDVADVCVLVAAANRYADRAGFDLALRAAGRGAAVVFVLNRLPPTPELQRELRSDFARKLAVRGVAPGIGADDVIAVAEGVISGERSGLASEAALDLRKELERLGAERDAVRAAAVAGTIGRTAGLLATLRAELVTAAARRIELSDPVRLSYAAAAERVGAAVRAGTYAELESDSDALAAALGAAAARHAGRASLASAGRWERVQGQVPAALFTHGAATPEVARERLEFWEADLPRLATALSGKPVRRRVRSDLIAAVRAAVIDPTAVPGRRRRRLLRRHPGLAEAAREHLVDELSAVVATDAARFTGTLGPPFPAGVLADLTLEDPR